MLSSSKELSLHFLPGTGGTSDPGLPEYTYKPCNILSWATKGLDRDLCPCEDNFTSGLSLLSGPSQKVQEVQDQRVSTLGRSWILTFFPLASWIFQNCHIFQIGKHPQSKKKVFSARLTSLHFCVLSDLSLVILYLVSILMIF